MGTGVYKAVNVLRPDGRPMLDPKNRKPVTKIVEMTEEELQQFELERAQSNQEP